MRTETTTRTLYKFDELSPKAQQKALDAHRYTNTDAGSEWWDSVYEDAANVGIKITGFDTGRGSTIDGTVDQPETTAHKIVKEHGEECETYKTAAAYLKERDAVIAAARKDENGDWLDENELDANLDNVDTEFTRSILEDYLQTLRDELKYLESDEAVKDSIEANDYEFQEDGKPA